MTKKFYRSIIVFEVLHDRPLSNMDLGDIVYECDRGDCVGSFHPDTDWNAEVDGPEMAEALTRAGSEPEFFNLDDDGEELE